MYKKQDIYLFKNYTSVYLKVIYLKVILRFKSYTSVVDVYIYIHKFEYRYSNDIATTKVRLIMKIVKTVPRIVEIYLAIKRK